MTVDQEILTELAKVRAGMTDLETRIEHREQTRTYLGEHRGVEYMLTLFCDGEAQLLTRVSSAATWGPAIRLAEKRA